MPLEGSRDCRFSGILTAIHHRSQVDRLRLSRHLACDYLPERRLILDGPSKTRPGDTIARGMRIMRWWALSSLRTRVARTAGVTIVGFGLLLALAHTPPLRARVLAWTLGALETYGIQGRAARLDYNLLTLDVRIYDVALAVPDRLDEPFFMADEIEANLGWPTLWGRWSVQAIEIRHPRIVYTRSATGAARWPTLGRTSTRVVSSAHKAIGRFVLRDLEIAWRDDVTDIAFDLRGVSIDLAPFHETIAGPMTLGSARLRWRTRTTIVERFSGSLVYDGLALEIPEFHVELPEGSVRLSGRIDELWSAPRVAFDVRGTSELQTLASWGTVQPAPVGRLAFSGAVTGAALGPAAALTLTSEDVTWKALRHMAGEISLQVADGAVDIRSFAWRVAGGEVAGRGRVAFADSSASNGIGITWRDLDAATLIEALAPHSTLRIASWLAGRLDARWPSRDVHQLTATLELRAQASTTTRQGVRGAVALDVRDGNWHATVDQWMGDAIHVAGAADGQLNTASLRDTSLNGRVGLVSADLGHAWDAAHALGLVGAGRGEQRLNGQARADVVLSGTLGAPRAHADIESSGVRFHETGPGTIRAEIMISPEQVQIASLDGRIGADTLRASGRVTLATGAIEGRADWTIPDIAALTGNVPQRFRPVGAVAGQAVVAGRWPDARVRATLSGTGLKAAGQQVDRWSADVRLEDRTVLVDRLELEQAEGRLSARGEYALGRGTYSVHVSGRQLQLDPILAREKAEAPIPLRARFDVDFDGAGSLDDPGGRGQLIVSSLSWDGWESGALRGEATIDRGTMTVDVNAPDLAATLRTRLALVPFGHFEIDGAVQDGDLNRALAGLPRPPVPITGAISVTAQATGELNDLTQLAVTADLQRLVARLDETSVRLERASRISYESQELVVEAMNLRLGDTDVRIGGRIGMNRPGSMQASLDGQLTDLMAVVRAVPSGAERQPRALDAAGTIMLDLTATGTLDRPVLDGDLTVASSNVAIFNLPPMTGASLRATYRDGAFAIERFESEWQEAHIAASGYVPLQLLGAYVPRTYLATLPAIPAPARLAMRVDAITPAVLAPFVPESMLAQINGRLAASLSIEADALSIERARGELRLDRTEVALAGLPLSQQRPTRIAFERGRARIVDWEWAGAGTTIALGGSMTLTAEPAFDLTADGSLDLRVLGAFLQGVSTAGRAQVAARIGGTAREPRLDGRINIAGGELRQENPRVIVTNLAGSLQLEGDRITATGLTGLVNGGTVAIDTDLRLGGTPGVDGSVVARGRGLVMDAPLGLRSEMNADVTLRLTGKDLALSGNVDVLRASYREPLSLTGGLLLALQQPAPVYPESPSRLEAMTLDVRVTTSEDVRVDNNYAQLALGADLTLVGTLARPGLTGRATPREGGQIFLGGTVYRLADNGSIDFANPARIEPDLNLTALTRVRDYDVTLRVKGPPAELATDLTSDPALGRADLVSLLVTGRTLAESPRGQPVIGSAELLGVLSGELGAAGRAIGLDVLRVERGLPAVSFNPGLVATETDPASRLTFGKKVTNDVEIVFSQSLRQSGGLTWIISYAPRRNIELRAVSHDNTNRTYDFRHDLSLGGPAVSPEQTPRRAPARILAVRFTGDAGANTERLLDELTLLPGDRFDFFRWQDDRGRLEAFFHSNGYLEARVRASRSGPDGDQTAPRLTLTYDIDRGPRTTLKIEGYALPDSTEQSLTAAWTRSAFDDFLLEDMKTIARRDLVSKGYLASSITAAVVTLAESGEKRIVLGIEPGSRTTHRDITFRGNVHIATERFVALMKRQQLDLAAWTDPAPLRDALLALYQNEGLLAASVRIGPVRIDGDHATLPVEISEGPAFTIAGIRIEGVTARPVDDVREALGLQLGETDRTVAVDEARARVLTSYRTRGFNELRLDVTASVVRETSEVHLDITVKEGPQQVLREIRVMGEQRSSPALISRALKLEIGQPVDLAAWQHARRRLYDSGVFRRVDVDAEPLEPSSTTPTAEQPTRAHVTLSEWPPLRLRYGFEVNDEASPTTDSRALRPGFSGDVTYRNLFGLAASTGVALRYSRDFRAVREFVTAPSLFGLPLTSNFFVSQSREEVSQTGARPFITDKLDLTAEQRFRPAGRVEVTYAYGFQRNHTFDKNLDPTNPFAFDLTVNIARLTSTIRFDSRDDLVDAARGWFHSSSVEYAPERLGSDLRFVKYLLLQQYYRPLAPRVVLASAARLGLAKAFGQELIPSERFFAGGGNSVRGYAEDALSPRNLFGSPVGGDALLVFNQELRFPLVWRLRGVGFFDAGRAVPTIGDLSLADLRSSVGFGVRVDTPFALLRVDFGTPLGRRPDERRGRWFFSIGQAF